MHRAVGVVSAVTGALLLALVPLGGSARAASSSGLNGDVVFVRGGTLTLVSAGSLNVTSASDPAWSPDGTKLAYVTGTTIHTCTISGSTCGSVVDTTKAGSQPAWSSDGTRIAYTATGGGIHVYTISGASDATITSGAGDGHPSWSSDGTKLAYDNGAGKLYTITAASSNVGVQVNITNSVTGDSDPAWSPDGASIAFQANSSGHNQIYVVSAYGGAATQVYSTSTEETAPNWSPDSTSIVYADASAGIEKIAKDTSGNWGTTTPTAVTTTAGDATPDWQTLKPTMQTAPTITSGAYPEPGDFLTATQGTWQGASSYSYVWQRCDASGASCSTIGGATYSSYTVVTADVGHTLRVAVVATNGAGSTTSSASAASALVVAVGTLFAPADTVYPTAANVDGSGKLTVGDTIQATQGTWTGSFPITYAYQWLRCDPLDPLNGSCYTIAGATSSALVVPTSVYGYRLRIRVTATNGAGSVSAMSVATPVVAAIAPTFLTASNVVGSNVVGQALSAGVASWSAAPQPTVTLEWRRCDAQGTAASCVAIPGATSSTYTPTPDDIGHALRVFFTGTNVVGSATGYTNHTYPIVDRQHFAPSATSTPAVAGFAVVGGQLTGSIGSFTGDTPIATTFQWQRCDAVGLGCRGIPSAKKTTYVPAPGDVGSTIRLAVWAKNAYGSIVAFSNTTDPVLGLPPHRRGKRIVGTAATHYVHGTPYDDTIVAGPGSVTIDDPGGYNRIYAGSGRDLIIVRGPGSTHVFGGTGSATIEVANGYKDEVTCVGTHDRVVADPFDVVTGCAVVVRSSGTSGSP